MKIPFTNVISSLCRSPFVVQCWDEPRIFPCVFIYHERDGKIALSRDFFKSYLYSFARSIKQRFKKENNYAFVFTLHFLRDRGKYVLLKRLQNVRLK